MKWMENINDLVQDCSNSIASAPELLQSCTKLSIYDLMFLKHTTITMVYHHHGIFGPKKVKGKVTVLSPHPGSELCSADFAFVPSLVIGPFTVHIRLDIHFNSLGSIQPLTSNFAPRLTNMPSQVPISSWVERSNAAWSALLRGTTSSHSGRVLNPGLDLDPNPESCTLPLDQLAALVSVTVKRVWLFA